MLSIIAYVANIFRGESGRGKRKSSFSFILSIALLFVTSGVWAADWTDADGNTYTAFKSLKGNGDGKGYLVTDIVPNCTDIVMMKFKPATVSSSYPGAYFCARNDSANGMFTCYRPSNKIRLDRGASNTANQKTSTGKISTSYEYLLTADYGRRTATIIQDGSSSDLFGQMLGGDASYTVGSPLAFFALHKELDGFNSFERGYIYYFELYDSNTNLTHCLLPAQRNTDSVYGFYDTRTGTFYPQSGGAFTAAARTVTVTGNCKKWIGRGNGVSMSDGANWEGGVAPGDGDNLDFTLAAPLAEINADMGDVTFGKVWIDDGDLPGFTGTLTATSINDLERMTDYDEKTADFSFTLAAPTGQDFIWNGGADANWSTTDASWLCSSAASVWYDRNNAIFNTADATATLTADATANSLAFNRNATVAGSATLTVPSVSVVADVAATVSAPTAGELKKTGAGMLTFTSSRTGQTMLSEGTLTMFGNGTTLDWSKLTLGTDSAKPVTLRFEDGAGLASPSSECNFGNVPNVTSVVCKAGGDWTHSGVNRIGRAAGANTTFVNESGDLTFTGYISVGAQTSSDGNASSELAVAAGTVSVSHSADSGAPYITLGSYGAGTLTVTNSGVFDVTASMALSIHSGSGTLNVSDGGTATIGTELVFGWNNPDAGAATVNLGTGGTLASHTVKCANYGTGTVNFDGGTLKAGAAATLIQSSDRMTVNVGANGGTIDNDGKDITIEKNFNGTGTIDLTGAGKTTFAAGVGAEGGVSVATGTTLALDGATQSSFGALTLAGGSTLDIATPAPDVAAFAATTLNLPAEGTVVTLTSGGGAFVEGIYAICKMSGVTAADGEKFAPSTGELEPSWSVDGDTLILTVGAIDGNTWTGGANDGNLSNPANWYGGAVPTSGTATINTSGELTVGALFNPDVIVFPETCGAVTIKGENTIDGLAAVTNLSSSTCTFEVPVAFADKIDVYQTAYFYINASTDADDSYEHEGGHVSFPGGVTGSSFAEGTSRMLEGAYYVPVTSGWQAVEADTRLWGIKRGASLTITGPSDETLSPTNTSMLLIAGGGAITTGVMRTSSRLSYRVYGEYVITNELEVALKQDTYIAQAKNGTYKFEKLTLSDDGTGWNFYVANSTRDDGTKHLYIGAGGINVNGTASTSTALVCGYDNKNSHDVTHLHPWHGDYAINGKGGSTRDILVYRTTHLYTEDENGVACTVTLNGIADVRATLTVNGSGRFQVNSNGMNGESGRLGSVTVTDSATLAYASGADLGTGAVTVGANATMELASGAHTFEGGLTLNDGATLAFNFTQRAVTPQIAIAAGKVLTVKGAVKVKIPADSKWPTGGKKVLTTCGGFVGKTVELVGAPNWVRGLSVNDDGNIVLDVKPMGTRVIVR